MKLSLFEIIKSRGTLLNGILKLGITCMVLNWRGMDDFCFSGRSCTHPKPWVSAMIIANWFQSQVERGISISTSKLCNFDFLASASAMDLLWNAVGLIGLGVVFPLLFKL